MSTSFEFKSNSRSCKDSQNTPSTNLLRRTQSTVTRITLVDTHFTLGTMEDGRTCAEARARKGRKRGAGDRGSTASGEKHIAHGRCLAFSLRAGNRDAPGHCDGRRHHARRHGIGSKRNELGWLQKKKDAQFATIGRGIANTTVSTGIAKSVIWRSRPGCDDDGGDCLAGAE